MPAGAHRNAALNVVVTPLTLSKSLSVKMATFMQTASRHTDVNLSHGSERQATTERSPTTCARPRYSILWCREDRVTKLQTGDGSARNSVYRGSDGRSSLATPRIHRRHAATK